MQPPGRQCHGRQGGGAAEPWRIGDLTLQILGEAGKVGQLPDGGLAISLADAQFVTTDLRRAGICKDMEQALGFRGFLVTLFHEARPLQHQFVAGPGQGDVKKVLRICLEIRAPILDEPPLGLRGGKSRRVDQCGRGQNGVHIVDLVKRGEPGRSGSRPFFDLMVEFRDHGDRPFTPLAGMPCDDLDRLGAVGGGVGTTVEIALARAGIKPAQKHLGAFAMKPGGGLEVTMCGFEVGSFCFKSQEVCTRLCRIGLTVGP